MGRGAAFQALQDEQRALHGEIEKKNQLLGKDKRADRRGRQRKEQKRKRAGDCCFRKVEEKKKRSERAEKEAGICEQLEEQIREEKACLELLRKVQQEQEAQ